jgi:hypothetical protein
MSAASTQPRPSLPAEPDGTPTPPASRTRRTLLAGLAGGAGALLADAVGRLNPARAVAAVGSPLLIGRTDNNAGTANTQLLTNSTITAFTLYQSGPGTALMGYVTRTSGNGRGVYGRSDSPNGDGVQARNAAASAGSGAAIRAYGVNNDGIVASTASASRTALTATNSGSGTAIEAIGKPGVAAGSATGSGVVAISTATSGAVSGVYGQSTSTTGSGLQGYASATSGANRGVFAASDSPDGWGVLAINPAGSAPPTFNYRTAIQGHAVDSTNSPLGVAGTAASTSGTHAYGVYGYASSDSGDIVGVIGEAGSTTGQAWAGWFVGNVYVGGTLSKTAGTFTIDHPLDPANKYLQHSFVESPDMMNVYNGNVTTDAKGEATVTLPDWFEALNQDFRYQLTPIGSFAQAMVQSKVKANRFVIATSEPNVEVSWQLTGIRHDAYAEAHRIQVEVAKTGEDKGKYLHPVEHDKPASERIGPIAPAESAAA